MLRLFDEIPDAGLNLVEFVSATSNLRDRCRAWLDSPQVIESIRQL